VNALVSIPWTDIKRKDLRSLDGHVPSVLFLCLLHTRDCISILCKRREKVYIIYAISNRRWWRPGLLSYAPQIGNA